MTLTQSELDIMGRDIKNLIAKKPTNRGFWGKFFQYYNENHDVKLHMDCRSCYPKVYNFIKTQFEQQPTN